LVFGTLEGELLFVNKLYELKLKLRALPDPSKNIKIEHILALKNGFAIAGSSAKILFFERKEQNLKMPYFLSKNKIELHKYIYNTVNNLVLLNDNTFLVGLSSGELLQATLLSNKSENGLHYKIESCILHLHNKKINCMSICERKSIFVSCSSDRTITVFNYLGNFY
jgi:WD40 repeat protein